MKVLVIPDVHGSHEWETAKKYAPNEFDYIVFLGDYFDSWKNEWPDQGKNFKTICNYVRQDTAHRKLLLGNHDWSYLSRTKHGGGVSGHQNEKIDKIRNLLQSNHDILDLAFEVDRVVFSHAGFSRTWVESLFNLFDYDEKNNLSLVDFLNKKWHSLSFIPGDSGFNYGFEELLDWHGFLSGSGNEVTQGPLWIRPETLLQDAFYHTQVVGHTEYCNDDFVILCEQSSSADCKNTLIMTDSESHKVFGMIDTAQF